MGAITPAMTAAMAWVLLGTVEKRATLATLVPVMGGIVLAAGFEPSYTAFGFGASMGAAAARALKAVLQARARC
jgi:drug/metabolite transporter (DMT)-like permease